MSRFSLLAMMAGSLAFGISHGWLRADEPKSVRARVIKSGGEDAKIESHGKGEISVIVTDDKDEDGDSKPTKRVVRRILADGQKKGDDGDISVIVTDDKDGGKPVKRIVRRVKAADGSAKMSGKETYLGVVTEPVPSVLAAQMPKLLSKDQGLVVTRALENSPAAKCGIKANDVLALLGDQKIFNSEQLKKLVSGEKPGTKVELGVIREGSMLRLSATLAERPVSAFAMAIGGEGGPNNFIWRTPGKDDGELHERIHEIHKEALDKARGEADRARARAEVIELRKEIGAKARQQAEAAAKEAHEAHKKAIEIYKKATDGEKSSAKGAKGNKTIALSITVDANAKPKVSVDFTDENGKKINRKFEGRIDEIHDKLKDLPTDIRDKIHESLKNIHIEKSDTKSETKDKKSSAKAGGFRVFMENKDLPNPTDGKGAFRFRIGKPDGSATLKDFDFDVDFDLDMKDIMKHLGDLGPETKAQIEKALKSVKIPKVDVSVEKSQ